MQAFNKLLDIIITLRSEKGCPWDRKQTLKSLMIPLLEEYFELGDAVQNEDSQEIREEIGDVFFMILLIGYIAEQQGIASLTEIMDDASNKLIYRHPHVFADMTLQTEEQVIKNWEMLKQQEKSHRTSIFDGIPKSLPASLRFEKIKRKISQQSHDLKQFKTDENNVQSQLKNLLIDLSMEGYNINELIHQVVEDIIQQYNNR
ncbi:tetrapyrrole methylase family protein / MazG family protein [Brevinema andersonii]|uniref:Tetrapyrrole methylase family protein / MazG family protein n=1 Tax=Brevinema andersonii TaxID=34097 RepID=A0A1I1DJM1_BREAD|nr:MazG nucleotide pyrophosphohydrolase domain-containing protein [Brevinema andersonii]SFB75145.1 tetrapyrrole methylase family protein / MazG family protein [Brevinema andersonii]